MYIFLIIIHVLVCFLMVGAILLQSGKGAEIGASFGGSSQTVFGSRGPANFLSKFTVVVAAIFMLTSLSLAMLAKERTFSSTVIDLKKKESSQTTPETTPATPAAPQRKATLQATLPPANTNRTLKITPLRWGALVYPVRPGQHAHETRNRDQSNQSALTSVT